MTTKTEVAIGEPMEQKSENQIRKLERNVPEEGLKTVDVTSG